jgi:hypothetical protein
MIFTDLGIEYEESQGLMRGSEIQCLPPPPSRDGQKQRRRS